MTYPAYFVRIKKIISSTLVLGVVRRGVATIKREILHIAH